MSYVFESCSEEAWYEAVEIGKNTTQFEDLMTNHLQSDAELLKLARDFRAKVLECAQKIDFKAGRE